ncbi:MAG: hypothetical protein CM15mP84_11010 [Cellvibrionales bacterium]|nr:MAG: hypothetical protein CM15mP84_11010 [Cellvibrionales bacterium]
MSIWSRSITARGALGHAGWPAREHRTGSARLFGLIDLPSYMEPVLLGIVASSFCSIGF